MAECIHAPSITTLSFTRKSSTFSLILVKVFGTRTLAVMSWLRNASFLFTEFVLLLGDSGPRLFLTGPGSKMACGLWMWYTVMSTNTQAFNTYLFWGSGSHRPKREAYVKIVCCHTHTLAPTGFREAFEWILVTWKQAVREQQKILT